MKYFFQYFQLVIKVKSPRSRCATSSMEACMKTAFSRQLNLPLALQLTLVSQTQCFGSLYRLFSFYKYYKQRILHSGAKILSLYFRRKNISRVNTARQKTKEKQRNDISDIFTSEDVENISLLSRMDFLMENTSCLFFGKTLIFM